MLRSSTTPAPVSTAPSEDLTVSIPMVVEKVPEWFQTRVGNRHVPLVFTAIKSMKELYTWPCELKAVGSNVLERALGNEEFAAVMSRVRFHWDMAQWWLYLTLFELLQRKSVIDSSAGSVSFEDDSNCQDAVQVFASILASSKIDRTPDYPDGFRVVFLNGASLHVLETSPPFGQRLAKVEGRDRTAHATETKMRHSLISAEKQIYQHAKLCIERVIEEANIKCAGRGFVWESPAKYDYRQMSIKITEFGSPRAALEGSDPSSPRAFAGSPRQISIGNLPNAARTIPAGPQNHPGGQTLPPSPSSPQRSPTNSPRGTESSPRHMPPQKPLSRISESGLQRVTNAIMAPLTRKSTDSQASSPGSHRQLRVAQVAASNSANSSTDSLVNATLSGRSDLKNSFHNDDSAAASDHHVVGSPSEPRRWVGVPSVHRINSKERLCSKCGTPVSFPETQLFCCGCGNTLTAKPCPSCKLGNPASAKFCMHCGGSYGSTSPRPNQ